MEYMGSIVKGRIIFLALFFNLNYTMYQRDLLPWRFGKSKGSGILQSWKESSRAFNAYKLANGLRLFSRTYQDLHWWWNWRTVSKLFSNRHWIRQNLQLVSVRNMQQHFFIILLKTNSTAVILRSNLQSTITTVHLRIMCFKMSVLNGDNFTHLPLELLSYSTSPLL